MRKPDRPSIAARRARRVRVARMPLPGDGWPTEAVCLAAGSARTRAYDRNVPPRSFGGKLSARPLHRAQRRFIVNGNAMDAKIKKAHPDNDLIQLVRFLVRGPARRLRIDSEGPQFTQDQAPSTKTSITRNRICPR